MRDLFYVYPHQFIEETRRILADRFEWTQETIATALDPIVSRAVIVEPKKRVNASADPDDNRILECGVESQSDFVTGDDHLLRLGTFKRIRILRPRQFLEICMPHEGADQI